MLEDHLGVSLATGGPERQPLPTEREAEMDIGQAGERLGRPTTPEVGGDEVQSPKSRGRPVDRYEMNLATV